MQRGDRRLGLELAEAIPRESPLEDQRVYGYYTLLAGQLEHHQATAEASRGLSQHFPIPVAILARLAVDVSKQGQGIGAALLHDALVRVVHASEEIAVRAVVVHAVFVRVPLSVATIVFGRLSLHAAARSLTCQRRTGLAGGSLLMGRGGTP